jgi:aminoglycoside phosphotransferase (APT) family kinase protein
MVDVDWRESGFRERRPSSETLSWVARSTGRRSRVVGYRRLTGGFCSAVHRVTVERDGVRSFVVLRQYPAGFGVEASLEREISILGLVAGSGLPVPEVLAADVAGASTGGSPSLVMTRLPGHVEVDPPDPTSWLMRIAEMAVILHAVDLPAPPLEPWVDAWIAPRDELRVPVGARDTRVWEAAFRAMAEPPPDDPPVFLHGNFLPVNLLWSRGKITGLTDWNGIHRGSRAFDVGHCRRYVAALHAADWAERLRRCYESITGLTLNPWWDLYALLHYDDNLSRVIRTQVAGRCQVDVDGMTARVEHVVEGALRRLG